MVASTSLHGKVPTVQERRINTGVQSNNHKCFAKTIMTNKN